MVVTEAELLGRGNHSIGDVAIGLSGSNFKTARQNCTRQCDYNLVANFKVSRATNYASNVTCVWANLNLAPTDGLAIGLWLLNKVQDLANHDRSGDFAAD